MTKKQLDAWNRIVKREQNRNTAEKQDAEPAGVHPYKRCGREDWHSLEYDEPVILLPLCIR